MRRHAATTIGGTAALVVAVAIALLSFALSDYHLSTGALVAVFFIAILGQNIVTGYTGQISIGQGAFMAFGGYTTAILTHDHGWNDLATLPVAALVGFGVGIVVGLPALRFHGVYLALTTFAVALAVPQIAKNYPNFTGGTEGLALPTHTGLWLYRTTWIVAGIIFVLAWLMLRGRTGRAFRAVRDSEIAAASSGVTLSMYKTLAFGISAAFSAVAGSLYVLVNNFVNPDVFALTLSLYILIGAVVGGLGSLWGVLVGACFVELLPIGLTSSHISSSQSVPVIFGAVVIAVDGPASPGRGQLAASLAFRIPDRSEFRRSPRHGGQMTKRLNGALALAVLVLAAVVVSASFAATSATPGVTSKTITIGGTFPLTGPAALYGVIPKAEAAYFAYVNAHGGVNKRQIVFKYYDDGYNPANTVPLTKKLVQQDHVFAVYGSLGTAPTLATRDYLNQNKVPQVLVADG